MSEDVLVMNSSPTLAGMKTGSLFNLSFSGPGEMDLCLREWNDVLRKKGLVARILRTRNSRALVYVYRPASLVRDLRDPAARRLLIQRGYPPDDPESCIQILMERLSDSREFPHEIGLFLGYPPEDVLGFIRDANGQKLNGTWKVYGDVNKARKTFERFKKCTEVYYRLLLSGVPLERLTVAG